MLEIMNGVALGAATPAGLVLLSLVGLTLAVMLVQAHRGMGLIDGASHAEARPRHREYCLVETHAETPIEEMEWRQAA